MKNVENNRFEIIAFEFYKDLVSTFPNENCMLARMWLFYLSLCYLWIVPLIRFSQVSDRPVSTICWFSDLCCDRYCKIYFFVCMCLFCLPECSFYSKLKREGKWEKRNCVKEVKNKSSVFSSSVCLPICLCVKLLRPYFFFQLQVCFYLILAFDFYLKKRKWLKIGISILVPHLKGKGFGEI